MTDNGTMQTTQKTPRSESQSQRGSPPRSSPPDREASPPRSDGLSAGVVGAYLDLFGRPPIGDHPQMDGFTCGRILGEQYPEAMMQVMQGFREGVKAGTEAAERAGGQTNG